MQRTPWKLQSRPAFFRGSSRSLLLSLRRKGIKVHVSNENGSDKLVNSSPPRQAPLKQEGPSTDINVIYRRFITLAMPYFNDVEVRMGAADNN